MSFRDKFVQAHKSPSKKRERDSDESPPHRSSRQNPVPTVAGGMQELHKLPNERQAVNYGAFRTQLRPWQTEGLKWMLECESRLDQRGGILADDMGLGKTLTFLHLIATYNLPTLVVAPLTLIDEWQREVKTHCDYWDPVSVYVAHGVAAKRDFAQLSTSDIQRKIDGAQLVLTSYNFVAARSELFRRLAFFRIVLDEAHQIRNEATVAFGALDQLQAHYRWCCTGSPVNNNLQDLYSLIKWLRIEPYATDKDEWDVLFGNQTAWAAAMNKYILRRTKDILCLPPCITTYTSVELSPPERNFYDRIAQETAQEVGPAMAGQWLTAAPGILSPPDQLDTAHVFERLTRVRQVCNHWELAAKPGQSVPTDLPAISAKMVTVAGVLDHFTTNGGVKCVVFSQSVAFLHKLEAYIGLRGPVLHMNGTLSRAQRTEIQAKFRDEEQFRVLLASTMACATGLNLQAAQGVIIVEPWWNPQIERQAIDRVHRLGQEHTVNVYRIITARTIEERIWEVQQGKEELAQLTSTETSEKSSKV